MRADRRTVRIAIGTGLALPALALAGEGLAPPEWEPPPVPDGWAFGTLPQLPAIEVAEPGSVGDVGRQEVRIDVRDAAGGITSSVLLNAALGLTVASAIFDAGSPPIAQGGWLAVRLGALAALALEVAAVDTTVTAVGEGWRPSPARTAAVFGVIGGTGLLLVIDAYMGLFAPRW